MATTSSKGGDAELDFYSVNKWIHKLKHDMFYIHSLFSVVYLRETVLFCVAKSLDTSDTCVTE